MTIVALIIIVALLLLEGNYLYKRTNAYTNQFVDIGKFKHLKELSCQSVDVVALGSNAPKFAFNFSDIENYVCENWAVGPETFEYDFILLKKFADKLKTGATVIWPICPGKFFLDKFKNKSDFVKYYKLLNRNEFPDYNRWQYISDYRYPLVFHPKRVKRLLKDVKRDTRLEMTYNPMSTEEVDKNASWWIHSCWNPEFNIDIENMGSLSISNQKAVEYNIGILKEAIDFCKIKELRLIFTYLPLTEQLGQFFSCKYVDTYMTQYVKMAIGDHNIISLVDYMRDKRFQNKDYYINSFFMNQKGARIFTKAFIKENINE